jgi:hypothetical protein
MRGEQRNCWGFSTPERSSPREAWTIARLAAKDSDDCTKDPQARGVIRTDEPRVAVPFMQSWRTSAIDTLLPGSSA